MARKKKDNDDLKPANSKKKRKVGRPKKRGRKRKYTKSKKKNTKLQSRGFGSNVSYNRVRSLLWENYKNDFVSYRDFISNSKDENGNKIKGTSIVSQVYNECKDVQCSDDDINQIYLGIKGQDKDSDVPAIPESYFEPRPYWELITENFFDGLDERLWIVSPMLLTEPFSFLAILGWDRCINENNEIVDMRLCNQDGYKFVEGKKIRFKSFVDYCNQIQALNNYEIDSQNAPHFKFIGNAPNYEEAYWNDVEKRWEIEIVPCLQDGSIESFDFVPTDDPELSDDFVLPTPKPKPDEELPTDVPDTTLEKTKIEEFKKDAELERQIKLTKSKIENLEKVKESIFKDIDKYIALGKKAEPLVDKALIRLDKINDEIDLLLNLK
jgi:hypothetical protein